MCCHKSLNRGITGSMRLPKDESCVMKYPNEFALACCKRNKIYMVKLNNRNNIKLNNQHKVKLNNHQKVKLNNQQGQIG